MMRVSLARTLSVRRQKPLFSSSTQHISHEWIEMFCFSGKPNLGLFDLHESKKKNQWTSPRGTRFGRKVLDRGLVCPLFFTPASETTCRFYFWLFRRSFGNHWHAALKIIIVTIRSSSIFFFVLAWNCVGIYGWSEVCHMHIPYCIWVENCDTNYTLHKLNGNTRQEMDLCHSNWKSCK